MRDEGGEGDGLQQHGVAHEGAMGYLPPEEGQRVDEIVPKAQRVDGRLPVSGSECHGDDAEDVDGKEGRHPIPPGPRYLPLCIAHRFERIPHSEPRTGYRPQKAGRKPCQAHEQRCPSDPDSLMAD
jgi:hypothetical protein